MHFWERGTFFGERPFYFILCFYSVIVQLLFLVHILILLIVCSFPAFPPAHLPLRSVRLAIQCQCQPPTPNPEDTPDFNRHGTLAATALTYLQFWLHDTQTSVGIPH